MSRYTIASQKRQRGMATVMMSMLVGLAIIGTSMAVVYSVKGTQQRQLASHAQTNAQGNAWLAIDVVRQYFLVNAQLVPAWLGNFPDPVGFDLSRTSSVTVSIESIEANLPETGWYRLTSNVLTKDSSAQSASTLQIVVDVLPPFVVEATTIDADGTFGSGLKLSGNIAFNVENGAIFRVDGDISGRGTVGATYLDIGDEDHVLRELVSTGSINYGSDIYADNVWANGDITLSGGAHGGTLRAVGAITITGGTNVGEIYANGDINLGGSSTVNVNSRSDVFIKSGGSVHGDVTTLGNITVTNANSAKSLTGVESVNVLMNYGSFGLIKSNGDTQCKAANFNGYISIITNTVTKCAGSNITKLQTPINVATDIMEELQPQTIDPPKADAWPLKAYANYAFELVDENGTEVQKVTVLNVDGVPNGTHDLTTKFITDYLCELNTTCIRYVANKDAWTLDHNAFAPGVLWFEGSYETTGNGTKYNSIIATGNIGAEGIVYAPNYDGLQHSGANICGLAYTGKNFGRPTNFCDENNQFITPAPLVGYTALYAGSIDQDDSSIYHGGIIRIGAGNEIFGHIIAGDVVETSGNTIIHGKVSASGEGISSGNSLGASTTIDTKGLPTGFLDMALTTKDNEEGPAAKVGWVRYL